MGGGLNMPNRIQKSAQRARYNMKYKARGRALPPDQMRAKALAENELARLVKLQEEE